MKYLDNEIILYIPHSIIIYTILPFSLIWIKVRPAKNATSMYLGSTSIQLDYRIPLIINQ